MKLENKNMEQCLKNARDCRSIGTPTATVTDVTGITGRGRPDIEAVSAISFDLRSKKSKILDSEVSGMEKFAKVRIPQDHQKSGRGKKQASINDSEAAYLQSNPSSITNRLSDGTSQIKSIQKRILREKHSHQNTIRSNSVEAREDVRRFTNR